MQMLSLTHLEEFFADAQSHVINHLWASFVIPITTFFPWATRVAGPNQVHPIRNPSKCRTFRDPSRRLAIAKPVAALDNPFAKSFGNSGA